MVGSSGRANKESEMDPKQDIAEIPELRCVADRISTQLAITERIVGVIAKRLPTHVIPTEPGNNPDLNTLAGVLEDVESRFRALIDELEGMSQVV